MRKSTDQAVTFGTAVTVVSGLTGGTNGDLGLTGIRQGTATASSFRSNEFPHVAVNPVSGHIYVTFNDNPAGTDKADIYMVMSTDGGATWSARTQVNDDLTTTDQWQPTIAVTPDGLNIGIFYYSRQEDAANNLFKYYGRTGSISGSTVTFTPSFPISDVASLPEFGRDAVVNSVYMGDYNHASATTNEFHVVWSDNRDDLPGGAPRKDPNVYYEKIVLGPPCPVGQATNPSPPNGAVNIPITGNTATWTNDALATSIEVFFNGASVYSGAPITSLSLAGVEPFDYSTTYNWRVDGSDGNCTTFGTTWTFTTLDDPNIVELFCDDFTAGIGNWTVTNDGGTCVWLVFNPPYPNAYTLPATSSGGVLSADSDECGSGSTLLSTATLTSAIDATLYQSVWLEFDNDWNAIDAQDFCYVDVSIDGGTTWQNVLTFDGTDVRNTHEVWDLTALVAENTFNIRFVSVQPGWDWWWAVDNICIYGSDPVPVELTSFTATSNGADVELKWTTATETNNQGFQVEKISAGGTFEQIGYVAGFGTTTEPKTYSFIDSKLESGDYTYRIKQIDFDGTFAYSDEVNVAVELPLEYALEQNYPNPFNPSTTIKYSIPEDGFVKLAVYNMLGEEVAAIVSTTQKAGRYEVNFNASQLSSGVYVYRIEASNYVASKKLMLLK